jgi:urea ABC transporter permease protein UrtB
MSDPLSVLSNVILLSMVLTLASLGLAVIFGVLGVINLGHGAMLTLGAYTVFALTTRGQSIWLGILLAPVVVGVIGLLLEWLLVRHLYEQPEETLLVTWGFSLIVVEAIKIVFGPTAQSVPNPFPGAIEVLGVAIPAYRLLLAGLTLALILATAYIFYRTKFGLQARAVVQRRDVAALMGVDVHRVYRAIFIIGSALAGLAGALLSPLLSVEPLIGLTYLTRAFFVVIVGGVGQIFAGTLVGAGVIGGSESIFSTFTSQAFAQTVVFALGIIIIRLWPTGIISRRRRE